MCRRWISIRTTPIFLFSDNLNTHQSEALVRFVIYHDQLDISPEELGQKGCSGILSSQDTRKQFLDSTFAIRLLKTAKSVGVLSF